MNKIQTVGIIGLGNLGTTLAYFLLDNSLSNIELSWICSSHLNSKTWNDIPVYANIKNIDILPDLIFICVKDDFISETFQSMLLSFGEKLQWKYVVHTAGVFGLEVLCNAEKYGAIPVAAHPFQTFASQHPGCLANIAWGIELNNDIAKPIFADFIHKLHGKAYFLSERTQKQKALYHVAAVGAANYLTSAVKYSATIADNVGIDKVAFLIPIIQQTIVNCIDAIKGNTEIPITGPIARKDQNTITQHLKMLESYPQLKEIYIKFSEILVNLN